MRLNCDTKDFIVTPVKGKADAVRLSRLPTSIPKLYKSKSEYRRQLDTLGKEMSDLQRVLYAHGRYALLLIFQGMDTSGKDGAIRHVMSGVNPQGCQVHSFGPPSQEELAHDFLWRTTVRLPRRGHIGIFNRSYYEEVLIVKAEPAILAAQPLPEENVGHPKFWRDRYRDIVFFEQYLRRNGTRVLKFFLHLSNEEQRLRLLARAREPEKNWKISPADLKSRSQWDLFQKTYAECLQNTSHDDAPWHAVPADDKRNARLIVSQIIVETLNALPIAYPTPDEDQLAEVQRVRKKLERS